MSPYRSKAQQKYFHYLEQQGKLPKKTVREFDDETDFDHLPERKMSHGGMADHMEHGEKRAPHRDEMMPRFYNKGGMVNYDEEMGEAEEYDSIGEPHTEDELEDKHPMEYMSYGGRAKKMAYGGRLSDKSKFIKALKRGM